MDIFIMMRVKFFLLATILTRNDLDYVETINKNNKPIKVNINKKENNITE